MISSSSLLQSDLLMTSLNPFTTLTENQLEKVKRATERLFETTGFPWNTTVCAGTVEQVSPCFIP